WGYPEEWIEAWTPLLTIAPPYVEKNDVWVAAHRGETVGWVSLVDAGTHWAIDHLWLLPAHHGRGLGRRLFETARAEAARRRPGTLRIEADPYAAPFYERCGARQVDSVPAPVLGTERRLPLLEIEVR